MARSPLPADDVERVAALHALGILDTPPEPRFERVVRLATHLFAVPMALVSLVDAERQWFKAQRGMGALRETHRDLSFCSYAILSDQPLIIEDATADPRFADNALVTGPPHIRFYAGHPLHSREGFRLGTLCILDTAPRTLDDSALGLLADLAAIVENELVNSELNHALQQNRAAEQRYRELAENSSVLIQSVTGEGRFLYTNPTWQRVLGYREEELERLTLWDVVHPAFHGAARERLERVLAGEAITYQSVFVSREGKEVTVEGTATCQFEGERPVGSRAILQDVTERRRTERALLDSESRFRALTDATFEGIAISKGGIILEANRALADMMGYSHDALIGARADTFAAPGYAEQVRQAIQQRREAPYEVYCRRADGHLFPVEISAKEMEYRGEQVRVTAIRDISRLKQQEKELREQYQRAESTRGQLRAILDATSEALLLAAPDRRFLNANQRFSELFEIPVEDLAGRAFNDYREQVTQLFEEPERLFAAVSGSASNEQEVFTVHLQQKWPVARDLELYSAPVHAPDGTFLGRLYVFRDVTREREVNRLKTEFVSMVSHELRTPLTAIKGYVDLLVDEGAESLDEEQKEFLGIISFNTERLVTLISDLLDISRIEAGKIDLMPTPVALLEVIGNVVDSLRPALHAKQQTLVIEVPETLPTVLADSPRLIQILTNLLSNANKYTPLQGTIAIRAGMEGEMIRVSVQDNGVGIPTDELARLFEKFFRASTAALVAASGTGLGLAITRSLVELHGGRMLVDSRVGQGSTFSFTLPLAPAASFQQRVLRHMTQEERPRHSILVVEDDVSIGRLLRRGLRRSGYAVELVTRGREAVERARLLQPDLITLDVLLPDMDGYAVLEALKSDPASAHIPVLMLSILPDTGWGVRLGAVDFVTKPADAARLVAHIDRILTETETVLIADADPLLRAQVRERLGANGYRVVEAADGQDAIRVAQSQQPNLLLLSSQLPLLDGVSTLRALRADPATRHLPVILMTDGADEVPQTALATLGVTGVLQKGEDVESIAATIAATIAAGLHPLPREDTP